VFHRVCTKAGCDTQSATVTLRMTPLARSVRVCRWWNVVARAMRVTSITTTSTTTANPPWSRGQAA
jgi:hypothetical protein